MGGNNGVRGNRDNPAAIRRYYDYGKYCHLFPLDFQIIHLLRNQSLFYTAFNLAINYL